VGGEVGFFAYGAAAIFLQPGNNATSVKVMHACSIFGTGNNITMHEKLGAQYASRFLLQQKQRRIIIPEVFAGPRLRPSVFASIIIFKIGSAPSFVRFYTSSFHCLRIAASIFQGTAELGFFIFR